jgi:hypothetical protein
MDVLRHHTLKYARWAMVCGAIPSIPQFPIFDQSNALRRHYQKNVLAVSEARLAGLHVLQIVPPSPIWKPSHSCLGLYATTFRGVETILDTIVSARAGTWAWTSVWHFFVSCRRSKHQ